MRLAVLDSGQKIVTSNLLLHYDAAQLRSYPGSGTTWTNLATASNNSTLTNGPTFNSSNGGSIVFDASDDYTVSASNPNIGNITTSTGYTICSWVYPTFPLPNQRQAMIGGVGTGNSGDWNYGLMMFFQSFGSPAVRGLAYAHPGGVSRIDQDIWTNNAWNFCCAKVKGTSCELYQNGSKVGSTLTINSFINTGTTYRYIVGLAYSFPPFEFKFAGRCAVTMLYNRDLTDTEILQNFNANRSRFGL
jgi:hypothetical protein